MGKRARRSRTLWVFGTLFLAAAATELLEPARAAFPAHAPLITLVLSALAIALRLLTAEQIERPRRAAPPSPGEPGPR